MGIERINEFWPEWKVGEVLGEGSFGKVYSAEKTLAGCTTKAAIKVISIPSSNAEVDALEAEGLTEDEKTEYFKEIVDDFVNEIKLMITLKGAPNIVSVEDYNILPCHDRFGWDIFIRMERLTSFKEYQKTNRITESDVTKLGVDIASALEICQQRGIIHRDIKPANIFIDDFGNFKLGDFGVAKQLEKTTGAASAKGTFTYMAPEATKGERYDHSVDLYSLGLVLYSLLNNNRPPFISSTATKVSYNERIEANSRRLHGEPLPPLTNASPNLSDVILTASSYSPQMRFKSATAFKRALQSCCNVTRTDIIINRANPNDNDSTVRARLPVQNIQDQFTTTEDATQINIQTNNKKPTRKKIIVISALILIPILLIIGVIGFFIAGRAFDFFEMEKIGGTTVVYWRGEISISGEGGMPNDFRDQSKIMRKYHAHATSLKVNEGITVISENAFDWLSKIETVSLPATLTEIEDEAFMSCESLKEVTIPDSVERIGSSAFSICSELEEIKLSDDLEYIGDGAFSSCSSLEEIVIPKKVTKLYDHTFSGCSSLKTIYINNPDFNFDNNLYTTANIKIRDK